MSRNVTKVGQHGSGSPKTPKTALGCKSSILAIPDRSGLVEHRPFFSRLLCLARISKKVTEMGQHGSGSLGLRKVPLVAKVQFWQFPIGLDRLNIGPKWVSMGPESALGCKNSIEAIHDRSMPIEERPYFQSCSV